MEAVHLPLGWDWGLEPSVNPFTKKVAKRATQTSQLQLANCSFLLTVYGP
jgi:hypothetical protein